jgi:hypothetical protein
MAAPTKAANVKKALANSEPSTHGTKRTFHCEAKMSAFGGKADVARAVENAPPARQSSYSIEMSFPV